MAMNSFNAINSMRNTRLQRVGCGYNEVSTLLIACAIRARELKPAEGWLKFQRY